MIANYLSSTVIFFVMFLLETVPKIYFTLKLPWHVNFIIRPSYITFMEEVDYPSSHESVRGSHFKGTKFHTEMRFLTC